VQAKEDSMTASHRLRLLSGRSSLAFLLGVAFLIFVAIIFANLAMERSAAQAEHDLAQAKVDQLLAQKYRLQIDLEQAQNGQQLPFKAYRLFGLVPPGWKVIEALEPPPAEPAPVNLTPALEEPFWAIWWQKLRQP
jgi:hypothetical protein